MKAALLAAAGIAAATLSAWAEEPKPLSLAQCVELYMGLTYLDGYDRVVKESGNEKIVKAQYKLGESRMTVALNQGALRPIVEAANKTRQAMLADLGPAPDEKSTAEQKAAYAKALAAAMDTFERSMKEPCPVTPGRIKLGNLNLGDGPDQNQIPPSVISAIMPIVDGAPR